MPMYDLNSSSTSSQETSSASATSSITGRERDQAEDLDTVSIGDNLTDSELNCVDKDDDGSETKSNASVKKERKEVCFNYTILITN